jgi:DNA-binding NarL/FixJ family response regulator
MTANLKMKIIFVLSKTILNKMGIIIADSNDIMRIGLRTVLSNDPSLTIVGDAQNNQELLDQIKAFGASIVLIDFTSQGFDINIISKVLKHDASVKFVAITPDQSAQTLVDAIRTGVISYVKKDCELSEILDAVKETKKGNRFFCGQLLETIQRANIDVHDIDVDGFTCEAVILTERETEIIKLIAEGLTNIQIADLLFLSTHTINTHRKNIMGKLGVRNTAGIVMYAVKTELVHPNKFLFAPNALN